MTRLFAFIALFALAPPAMAQQANPLPQAVCAGHEQFDKWLADEFGEHEHFVAPTVGGRVLLRLFINEETQTWTIASTDMVGFTCMIDSGTGFVLTAQGNPA